LPLGDKKSKDAIAMQHNIVQRKNGKAAPAFSANAPENTSHSQVFSYIQLIQNYMVLRKHLWHMSICKAYLFWSIMLSFC
jgi:hypothetical protein